MPNFYTQSKSDGSKKSRTSESSSHVTSEASTQGGLNLNEEAGDYDEEVVREVQPMVRERSKKKEASQPRSEASTFVAADLVVTEKWSSAAMGMVSHRKEASSEYLIINERELEMEDMRRREQVELKWLKLAQKDKELELQRQMFEFQQQEKFEKDIMYYNEQHDHLTGKQLATVLTLKQKIKERYNLDY